MARSVWRNFSVSSQPSSSAMMDTILGSASSAACQQWYTLSYEMKQRQAMVSDTHSFKRIRIQP
jgi:hypothetical protein